MSNQEIVDAIYDQTRVLIALSGKFESQADAVRKLNEMSIPNNRIAKILEIPTKDVASIINRKNKTKDKEK